MAYIGHSASGNFTTKPSKDTFSGDGSTTAFTLSEGATTNTVDVFVENVRQEPTTAYSVNGTTLTFTEAPGSGTNNIYVVNRGPLQLSATHPAAQALEASTGTFTGTLSGVAATFTSDLTVDTSTLKVDSTNNRVGVGTASPAFALDVQSTSDPAQIRLKEDGNTNGVKIVNFNGDEAQINNVDNGPLVIKTNDTERMRISNAGDVAIGTSSPNSYTNYTTVTINGAGASGSDLDFEKGGTVIGSIFSRSSDAQFTVSSYSGDLAFRAGGSERVNIQASDGMLTALPVYSLTTSGSANVNVQSSGALLRSTSSEKYKQNIEDMELPYAQAILNLRPVYYKSKCALDNADDSHWGFIAEEVEKIDPRLVHYKTIDVTFKEVVDDKGNVSKEKIETTLETPEPEGVQYDRLTPAIVKLLQEQQKTIEALEDRIKTLEAG